MEILSANEVELLRRLVGRGRVDVEEVSDERLPRSTIMALAELLREKGAIRVQRVRRVLIRLTEEGLKCASSGLPERRIAEAVLRLGGEAEIQKLAGEGFSREELSIGIGWLRRKGWGRVESGRVVVDSTPPRGADEELLEMLRSVGELRLDELPERLRGAVELLKSRGLIESSEEEQVYIEATGEAERLLREYEEALSEITPEILRSRVWEEKPLKPYNITAEPPTIYPGKRHFYLEFIDKMRRILLSMGFTEMQGPYVELEFWNFDILFQPQDHPAREVHDTFWLREPSVGEVEELSILERVRRVHEHGGDTGSRGWGYRWSSEVARRLVLRTQTTAVSARYLTRHRKPPVKAFSISKVFRPDRIDAKHLPEFHQFEGIVMDEGLAFRDLLGIVKEFFAQLGIEKVRFRPSYFPFTEPSVEGYIYHPSIGWVECFGAGMFRPEVLEALGVEYPVAAWGMGVERIAMIYMGIDDIRDLYSRDITFLRRFSLSRV